MLHELARELRPRLVAPLVSLEGMTGEFSQHDSGQVTVRCLDGSSERLHFFVSRLKYSRSVGVRLVPEESSRRCNACSPGSRPGVGYRRRWSSTTRRRWCQCARARIQWNDALGQMALDYRLGPELYMQE